MMKKTLTALILVVLSCSVFAQTKHVGLWSGVSEGEEGFIKLDAQGYAYITANDETMGGPDFVMDNVHAKLTYKIDYSQEPHPIDFILTDLETNDELGRFLGIIQFLSDDEMKVRLDFSNSGRPENFLPEGNEDTVVFTREKE
jgi:hypothetical protein